MSLIYVTGLPGMGKTTLFNEMQSLGIEAYGVDEHDLADWVNKSTGVSEVWPKPTPSDFDTQTWYQEHDYVLSSRRLQELRDKAESEQKDIFVFGMAKGLSNCKPLFSKIFALYMDDTNELKKRIVGRKDVPYGKTEEEFAEILKWVELAPERYRDIGAIVLDANKPTNKLAKELISQA